MGIRGRPLNRLYNESQRSGIKWNRNRSSEHITRKLDSVPQKKERPDPRNLGQVSEFIKFCGGNQKEERLAGDEAFSER